MTETATTLATPKNGEATKAPLTIKDSLPMAGMVKSLANSTLVPKEYQGNVDNVMIAIDVAQRIGASPFAVMQNLDIIHGRPSWRATFLIATVNASKRFTPLRFRFEGERGSPEWGCRAYATCLETDTECEGTLITMQMAKAEGWSTKSGSKWLTMPEQMLRYRAAAFWQRVYCPELSLGIHTTDEVDDMHAVRHVEVTQAGSAQALQQRLESSLATAAAPAADTPAQPEAPPAEREGHWLTGLRRHSGVATDIRDLADKLVAAGWPKNLIVEDFREQTGAQSLIDLSTDKYEAVRDRLALELSRVDAPDGGSDD